MKSGLKTGLALGGGAVRGFSHIGVLEVFKEEGISVDVVTGTSIGAIIGGMYAAGRDLELLKKKVHDYLESDLFKKAKFDFLKEKDREEGEGIFYKFSTFVRKSIFYTISITKKSFISDETFHGNLAYLLDDIDIEDMEIPYAAVSVDLRSGSEVVHERGSLRKAVAASCALPGIIAPVEMNGRTLIDGGWIDAVPVGPAKRLGADVVIGVEVGGTVNEYEELKNGLDVVFRSDTLARHALAKEKLKDADCVIVPDVGDIHWADFNRVDDIIEKGREIAALHCDEIKRLTRKKRLRSYFVFGRGR